MSLFKKKRSDILDLTKWQESGLLERSRRIAKADNPPVDETKTIDLTASSVSVSSSANDNSALGFLKSLAGAESSSSTLVPNTLNTDAQGLRYKIEDLEYKFERLKERIDKLEENSGK